MNTANLLFNFTLVIAVVLVGGDIITRATPVVHTQYRRVLRAVYNSLRRNVSRFVRWAWRGYKQFIIGTGFGILATLYFTGHFG